MSRNDILIAIPTYNERENVERLCAQIIELKLPADIMFIDDNSPDGTGKVLDELAKQFPNVSVMHRPAKQGIGTAHLAGINRAYEMHYRTLVTMDADFTHSPKYILELLQFQNEYPIVVGSRYMQEKSLLEWNWYRKILTNAGHFMTGFLLGMPYDATGALRLYRLDKIPQGAFALVVSRGYSFFFESLYILNVNKFAIKEIPISLPARTYGHSKMTMNEVVNSVKRLFQLYMLTLTNRKRYIIQNPGKLAEGRAGDDNWDAYWSKKKVKSRALYDVIAAFYRRFIIKPSLTHFLRKHFPTGAHVLHAGCGSGQVDADLHGFLKITALDISKPALEIYRECNPRSVKIIHGSVLEIPVEDKTFDGVYNLGVMEHFTQEQIVDILKEFRRVIKTEGKVVLFWPPEFGLSVNVLKCVHFVLHNVLRKNIHLHPAEISRVHSRQQVERLCQRGGFDVVDYYFGIKDFFTQAVVVLKPSK